MGKKAVIVYSDDYTGQELSADEANEVTLRVGADEWALVLSEDSLKELRRVLEPFTMRAAYKFRGKPAVPPAEPTELLAADNGTAPETTQQPAGEVAPPVVDNDTYRLWWRGLNKPALKKLELPEPTSRGMVPKAVKEAYAAANS